MTLSSFLAGWNLWQMRQELDQSEDQSKIWKHRIMLRDLPCLSWWIHLSLQEYDYTSLLLLSETAACTLRLSTPRSSLSPAQTQRSDLEYLRWTPWSRCLYLLFDTSISVELLHLFLSLARWGQQGCSIRSFLYVWTFWKCCRIEIFHVLLFVFLAAWVESHSCRSPACCLKSSSKEKNSWYFCKFWPGSHSGRCLLRDELGLWPWHSSDISCLCHIHGRLLSDSRGQLAGSEARPTWSRISE